MAKSLGMQQIEEIAAALAAARDEIVGRGDDFAKNVPEIMNGTISRVLDSVVADAA